MLVYCSIVVKQGYINGFTHSKTHLFVHVLGNFVFLLDCKAVNIELVKQHFKKASSNPVATFRLLHGKITEEIDIARLDYKGLSHPRFTLFCIGWVGYDTIDIVHWLFY